MTDFLHNLIPVTPSIWALFFLLPAAIAFAGQLQLCRKTTKLSLRLFPLYTVAAILLCVILYQYTGFLAPVIGGFVALLLLGTACFILAGSSLGWLVHTILPAR